MEDTKFRNLFLSFYLGQEVERQKIKAAFYFDQSLSSFSMGDNANRSAAQKVCTPHLFCSAAAVEMKGLPAANI